MADEIRQYTVTVPAGTTAANPATFPMKFPPRLVEGVEIIVPIGSSGVVGFAIQVGGARVIPYASDQWVVTAGEIITWPLEHYPDSGDWSLVAYNTGAFDHSLSIRWLLKYVSTATSTMRADIIDPTEIAALAPSDQSPSAVGEQP